MSGLSTPMPKATVATMTDQLIAHKAVLDLAALFQARMVGGGGHAVGRQQLGQLVAAFAAAHVDHAGAAKLAQQGDQRLLLLLVVAHAQGGQVQVGPESVAHQHAMAAVAGLLAGLLAQQLALDVVAHAWGGSGGDGQDGRPTQVPVCLRQVEVVGAEIVAPDRDAVRLVHHQARHAPPAQGMDKGQLAQAFGGYVDETVLARGDALHDAAQVVAVVGAVDGHRLAAERRGQAVDLVLHQRDER